MININREKINHKVTARFNNFISSLCDGLSLPEQKNFSSVASGILGSSSVIIHRIAQHLDESISLKKTCKRLYQSLTKEGLSEKLSENLLKKQCRNIDDDTLILVDPSDILKPKAEKMEGLTRIRDGSTGERNNGYDLLNIVAVNKKDTGYEISPLCSDFYSNKSEIDTKSNKISDRINDITVYTGNKGIFVFDRGFDSRIRIGKLSEDENSFIIRSNGKRNLIINGKEQSFDDICKSVKLTDKFTGVKNKNIICGIKRVKVRLDPHPKKEPETADVWLVVCRFISARNKLGGYFYFLCDFPGHDLTLKEVMIKALTGYRMRWKIEEVHRQIKQDYGWEEMQLLSYQGLKNLNTILWIVVSFSYSLKSIILQLAEAYPSLLLEKKNDLKILYGFVYYRLFNVIKKIFSGVAKYKKVKYREKYLRSLQPAFKF